MPCWRSAAGEAPALRESLHRLISQRLTRLQRELNFSCVFFSPQRLEGLRSSRAVLFADRRAGRDIPAAEHFRIFDPASARDR